MDSIAQTGIVFVTGASRSGTTMLARILGNHSQIHTLRELHYFGDCYDPAQRSPLGETKLEQLAATILARQDRNVWGSGPTVDERRRARKIVDSLNPKERNGYGVFSACLADLAVEHGKCVICEQTPRNIFYARKILDNLPGALIVHLVRDPRAVIASQKNRWKRRAQGARHVPLSESVRNRVNYHPFTMARLWADANRTALGLERNPRVMIVRFEDLVGDTAAQVERICNFVAVEFEPLMTRVPRWGSSNVVQDDKPAELSMDVLDAWKHVLTSGEEAVVEHQLRDLMSVFSYDPRADGAHEHLSMIRYGLTYPLHLAGAAIVNPRRMLIQAKAMLRGAGASEPA